MSNGVSQSPATEDGSEISSVVRPRSAVSTGVGIAGLAGLIGWFAIARIYGMDGENSALASVFFCGLAMVLWSLFVDKVHRHPTTGIDWDSAPRSLRAVADTSLVKLAGLWVTWAIIGFAYGVLRYYWVGNYAFAMKVLGWSEVIGPPLPEDMRG